MQTFALISLTLMAALLYYLGYHFGRKDGRTAGLAVGIKLGRESRQSKIRTLEKKLEDGCRQYHLANANAKLGTDSRQTLLEIAEKLHPSSATFGALNAKPQAEQALKLRDQARALAELIQPQAQERAA
jgi:hypothetical protein